MVSRLQVENGKSKEHNNAVSSLNQRVIKENNELKETNKILKRNVKELEKENNDLKIAIIYNYRQK